MLLDLAFRHTDESLKCHQAGCPLAALVMLAAAFEAVVLGMVIAHEDELRAADKWPIQPSRKHLSELTALAKDRGWLAEPATGQVVEVLNKARTVAAHPGAYVRVMRSAPEGLDFRAPEGYDACLDIVQRAGQQLRDAHGIGLHQVPGG